MNGTTILINLIGGVALLLWGLRMVRIGINDAWGSEVRSALGASLSNRFKAFFTGLGVTVLLQSSSATALLTSSFSGQGIINTAPALAVLLGADVGTTLVTQILTFDLSALSPFPPTRESGSGPSAKSVAADGSSSNATEAHAGSMDKSPAARAASATTLNLAVPVGRVVGILHTR
ncbi:MAG: Na/Pi cotransporter family protein, partial [Proteobacteria bacterium]|nr:Na/Pi cotransporter family protein [Pseudomonadota bacterium]